MTKTEILLMIATASTTLCVVSWVKRLGSLVEKPLAEASRQVTESVEEAVERPKGFIDFATGRRVDIDPATGEEVFVD